MAFYALEGDRDTKAVEGSARNDWESIKCPVDSGHQRAGARVTDLFVDALSCDVPDFSWTLLSDIVITDRARVVLRDAQLTGFTVKPAYVVKSPKHCDKATLPRLWEFVVVGRGGPASKDSGIRKLRECGGCHLVKYSAFKHGIVVDLSAYDGSDFFTVLEYPKYVLVSERAKAVIERNHLTNVTFIESTALEWPRGVIEPT